MGVSNDKSSIWSRTQALLEAFDYCVDKTVMSSLNLVTRAPGNCTMFRTDRIFSADYDYWRLAEDSTSKSSYLWKPESQMGRNMMLQEDRRRTGLLLTNCVSDECIIYVAPAVAETYVPSSLAGFIAKYRRRYTSTLANTAHLFSKGVLFRRLLGGCVEVHSIVSMLAMPTLCVWAYSSLLVAFKSASYAGFIGGLWLLFLAMCVLFLNGHMSYFGYIVVLFFTAPVAFVYVPFYAVLTFTAYSWGTRAQNDGLHPRFHKQVGATYVLWFISIIIFTFVMHCEKMDTKCWW